MLPKPPSSQMPLPLDAQVVAHVEGPMNCSAPAQLSVPSAGRSATRSPSWTALPLKLTQVVSLTKYGGSMPTSGGGAGGSGESGGGGEGVAGGENGGDGGGGEGGGGEGGGGEGGGE
eukprot:1519339-Prymnesium_polylepis.1